MRFTMQRVLRGAKALGAVLTAGTVFQTTGCAPAVSEEFFNLASTIIGQLITSYVGDQLGVTGGF